MQGSNLRVEDVDVRTGTARPSITVRRYLGKCTKEAATAHTVTLADDSPGHRESTLLNMLRGEAMAARGSEGALLCRGQGAIGRAPGGEWTEDAIRAVLRHHLTAAGVANAGRYGTKSMKSGGVTEAVGRGVSTATIQHIGGWSGNSWQEYVPIALLESRRHSTQPDSDQD